MKLLNGKEIKKEKKEELKYYFEKNGFKGKRVGIFLLKDHKPSETYVNLKKNFGEDIGIKVDVFDFKKLGLKHNNSDYEIILEKIKSLNNNTDYVGLVIQLPLPDYLQKHKNKLLSAVKPDKDIDGLGGVMFGLSSCDLLDFTPATPASVLNILNYYGFGDVQGKNITIIGQSNLVGKPLALDFIKRRAEVYTFNQLGQKDIIKKVCKFSDIIISATGKVHLIDETYLSNNKSQILIDVGWGIKNGKVCGDIDFDSVKSSVKAITPVPGGVGPATVANLFNNIKVIHEQKHLIPYYLRK